MRRLVEPEDRVSQYTPPSVVFRIVPVSPTTYPVKASTGKWTENKLRVVPEFRVTQPAEARPGIKRAPQRILNARREYLCRFMMTCYL
jgi:hypothetical protein